MKPNSINSFACKCAAGCLLVFFSFTGAGCKEHIVKSNDWENPFPGYTKTISLEKNTTKTIPLDSATSLKRSTLNYIESINAVMAFNVYDRSLVLFDYVTGKLIKKTKFEQKGANGIGTFMPFCYSFHFINYDSIFLFNQTHSELFLVDTAGIVKWKYAFPQKGKNRLHPAVNQGEPIFKAGNQVFFPSYPGRSIRNTTIPFENNLLVGFDLSQKNVSLGMSYPELYRKALWGYYMHQFSMAFNSNTNSFIYSFPIDHNIYVTNTAGQVTNRYYAGSDNIKKVEPLQFGKIFSGEPGKDDDVNNILNQRSYGRILYDPYAHMYYRVVTSSAGENDLITDSVSNKKEKPPFSIILLDEHFKKLGEQSFSVALYSPLFNFVTPDGLCMPRIDGDQDDNVIFDVFKPAAFQHLTIK